MNNIKEEFIKYFGEEKWAESEILEAISDIADNICIEYLGLQPIPVIFEEIPGNISVLDIKEKYVKLNPKYKNDFVTLVSALAHELEHYYQLVYVSTNDTPKAKRWKRELNNYITDQNPNENELQEIEIDAEAFAYVYMITELGIKYQNPNPKLDILIQEYISSKKILSDD